MSVASVVPRLRPQLVAIDIDDTLLDVDHTLHDEVVDVITEARARGVHVLLATGRMFRSALPFARRLGLTGHLITYNGGLVRGVDGTTLFHRPVPAEAARRLVPFAHRENLCLNLYIDDELVVERADDERVAYYVSIAQVEPVAVGDLTKALANGDPTKCLFVGDAERIPGLIEGMRQEFPDLQITRSKPRFIEVTQKGVDKGAALAMVARAYGVPMEAVMAIGDADNDAAMIAQAGWGVAVGNASDGAKGVADAVTDALRGRGVCEAIRRFVLV